PSPMPTYKRPSGPNASWPPLWFAYGWATKSSSRRPPGAGAPALHSAAAPPHGGWAAGFVLDDARSPVRVRVVDVEQMIRPVVRIEGQREETLLAAAHDLV